MPPTLWVHEPGIQEAGAAGFTLVELLIVVVIVGILAGVALPSFLGQQNKAKVNAANMQARGLVSYCKAHFLDKGSMPTKANDPEFSRLAADPTDGIIMWTVPDADNNGSKCTVKITNGTLTLSQTGSFSIHANGDMTMIPAKFE